MQVKITAKRQVTFPARVLDALGVGPGDRLELREGSDGYMLRPVRVDESMLGGAARQAETGPGHVRPEAGPGAGRCVDSAGLTRRFWSGCSWRNRKKSFSAV